MLDLLGSFIVKTHLSKLSERRQLWTWWSHTINSIKRLHWTQIASKKKILTEWCSFAKRVEIEQDGLLLWYLSACCSSCFSATRQFFCWFHKEWVRGPVDNWLNICIIKYCFVKLFITVNDKTGTADNNLLNVLMQSFAFESKTKSTFAFVWSM